MKRRLSSAWPTLRWVFFGALALSACTRKKGAEAIKKLSPPAAQTDTPLTDALSERSDAQGPAREFAPAWTRAGPHFANRGGVWTAVAVGWSRTVNQDLALAEAETQARAQLLRFVRGDPSSGAPQNALSGVRRTNTFQSPDDIVFVQVEAPAARQP